MGSKSIPVNGTLENIVVYSITNASIQQTLIERVWFILAFSLLLTANATNGTKSTDGKTFVCNQYNGQNSETNQAIKKIDKKLDKIIEMLQPCPNTGKKFLEQRYLIK